MRDCPKALHPHDNISYGFSLKSLTTSLGMHHKMEETRIFPILAARMPEFSPDATVHQEYEVMAKALESMEDYVEVTFTKLKNK